jgi:hypothetical protein
LRNETQQALQLIYDLFYGSGGKWPTFGQFQRALSRRAGPDADAARIVQRISVTLLEPPEGHNGYPAANTKLILTADGIARCTGSAEDIANLVTASRWLGRLVAHADLSSDAHGRGMRFTTRQLAEAVPLSLDSDQNAVSRLVAILQSEGWVQDDDRTHDRT